jgi:3'-phosphoadenosine 5'-phosphosulfate sulfotransferase (PAPS reductase)/FAD synthetase
MAFVYVVVENGDVYPTAFRTYAAAQKVVYEKHKAEIDRQIKENPDYKDQILNDITPSENPSGKTDLYVEKGINIEIHKLPITASGRRRKQSKSRSRSRR